MSRIAYQKRELILNKAKDVFVKKGYTAVTMQDIIDECGISRGGIYIYFSSVSEIYKEVMRKHNIAKLEESRDYISHENNFYSVLDNYFQRQKDRLLNMQDSLIMSMYEFRFAHKDNVEAEFFRQQYDNVKAVFIEILEIGAAQGVVPEEKIEDIAAHIVFFIEGISMLGTAFDISEQEIDRQIEFIKDIILIYSR